MSIMDLDKVAEQAAVAEGGVVNPMAGAFAGPSPVIELPRAQRDALIKHCPRPPSRQRKSDAQREAREAEEVGGDLIFADA